MILAYPWLTEGAIAHLEDWIKQHADPLWVLEYGAGGSTLWFAARGLNVVSIEGNQKWAARVLEAAQQRGLADTIDLQLRPRPYHAAGRGQVCRRFDIVLIDGRDRVLCAEVAEQVVQPGGLVMLDNSERARYRAIHERFTSWPQTEAVQKRPRILDGFGYSGWTTCWWERPTG